MLQTVALLAFMATLEKARRQQLHWRKSTAGRKGHAACVALPLFTAMSRPVYEVAFTGDGIDGDVLHPLFQEGLPKDFKTNVYLNVSGWGQPSPGGSMPCGRYNLRP